MIVKDKKAYDVTSPEIHPVVVKTTKMKKYKNHRKDKEILETRMVLAAYHDADRATVNVSNRLK